MVSQRNNTEKFLKKLGYSDKAIKGIHEMPFKTADQGKANAANDINNCQLCAPILLARFRGVNITAITYKEGGFMERLANNMRLAFEKNDNITYYKFEAKRHNDTIKTKEHIRNKIYELPNNSIFNFGYNKQINGEDGHIWTLIKSNDKLLLLTGKKNVARIIRWKVFCHELTIPKKLNYLE